MDTLFLIRDIIDLSTFQELDVLMYVLIKKKKAFDRVGHRYLFKTLEAFGFGEKFTSWIKLLYSQATVLLKGGGSVEQFLFREASGRHVPDLGPTQAGSETKKHSQFVSIC